MGLRNSKVAVFDIKPVDQAGKVDFAKIEGLSDEINLRSSDRGSTFLKTKARLLARQVEPQENVAMSDVPGTSDIGDFEDGIPKELIPNLVFGPFSDKNQKTAKAASGVLTLVRGSGLSTFHQYSKEKDIVNLAARLLYQKEELRQELEEELKKQENIEAILASVGGELADRQAILASSRERGLQKHPHKLRFDLFENPRSNLKTHLKEINSPAGREVEALLEKAKTLRADLFGDPRSTVYQGSTLLEKTEKLNLKKANNIQRRTLGIGLLMAFLVGGFFLLREGLGLKQDLTSKGEQAVRNLEQAKAEVEKFDFISAASSFNLAYKNFSDISSRLNLAGGSLASLLSAGGFGDLKSAKNLTQAGGDIAEAGKILTEAAGSFYGSNLFSGLGLDGGRKKSLSEIFVPFRKALVAADEKISSAGRLFASVDESIVPEGQRRAFLDFRQQLPLFEEFVGEAVGYADFLSEFTGASGPKKYLLLFQNNSELRPTGGFLGSYALVDFSRGFLRSLEVDDIYNIDGQAKKNIIPPRELQHITPTWGMRDANWFVNFPDSARKIMEMYMENNGGSPVDGVLAVTPLVVTKILEITGPVDMPEYGRSVGSENFLAEIQEEVEYGENRTQPKTILVDFTPRFLEKLSSLEKEKWLKVFQILADGVEQKHFLAYFKNSKLEETALKNGFGGEVKETDGDFLMVVHSNVKGSKTDAVIDNFYELESWISDGGFVEHSLKIKRKHNGGKTRFGFYNRTNYDFIRILVPEGSEILGVRGDYKADFKLLVDYGKVVGFETDPYLENYENCSYKVEPCTEAGKAVFGFWMKIEPGQEREVILKYRTPIQTDDGEYSLLVQKQPGTIDDEFSFNFELAENKTVIYKYPELAVDDNVVNFDTYLFKDLVLGFKFK